jgi:hypothetical protein
MPGIACEATWTVRFSRLRLAGYAELAPEVLWSALPAEGPVTR